jgi:hypothetical protein
MECLRDSVGKPLAAVPTGSSLAAARASAGAVAKQPSEGGRRVSIWLGDTILDQKHCFIWILITICMDQLGCLPHPIIPI